MDALSFFKCLSEATRLNIMLLLTQIEEICVCEFMEALTEDQPKVSRHLASLRQCELVADERRGKWVYYRLAPSLPSWCVLILEETAKANSSCIAEALTLIRAAQKQRGMTCSGDLA